MVSPTTEAQTAELFSDMEKTHGHCQLNLGASILSTFRGIITSRAASNSLPSPSFISTSRITVGSHILPEAATSNP
ncbi:hypothetical protein GB937_001465 [Aspergillus fischeri]|nr:hypothetical protein GB937_001465 [Aspergillus fischeri]